jgi:hypothetical protein
MCHDARSHECKIRTIYLLSLSFEAKRVGTRLKLKINVLASYLPSEQLYFTSREPPDRLFYLRRVFNCVWMSTTFKDDKMMNLTLLTCKKEKNICSIISFWWIPGVRILYADVSEHSVCSFFIDRMRIEHAECAETSAYKNSDAGESPKRKNTILRTMWNLEIKKEKYLCNQKILLEP